MGVRRLAAQMPRRLRRGAPRLASLILLTFAAVAPAAARPEGQAFTVYEARGDVDDGVAHIERLPKSPQALRGLIAMYAFQGKRSFIHALAGDSMN